MRSMKKSKERDTDSKNQPVVASVSKLICTTKGQSSTLNGKVTRLYEGVNGDVICFWSISNILFSYNPGQYFWDRYENSVCSVHLCSAYL